MGSLGRSLRWRNVRVEKELVWKKESNDRKARWYWEVVEREESSDERVASEYPAVAGCRRAGSGATCTIDAQLIDSPGARESVESYGECFFVALVDDSLKYGECWKGAFLDCLKFEIRRVKEEQEAEEYHFVEYASVETVGGG